MKTKLLIDADFLLHRASCSKIVTVDINDCERKQSVSPLEMLCYIKGIVGQMQSTLDAEEVVLYFSCSRNLSFRRKLNSEYKANRDSTLRHLGIKTLKEILTKHYKTVTSEFLEADDLIGIEATTPDEWDEKIIVGNDKDYLTVPAKYINFLKMDDGIHNTSKEEANRNFLVQVLSGDVSDGYAGCKGIGQKTAIKLVTEGGWSAVVSKFIDVYGENGENLALLNARMAYILRYGDLTEKGKVKLWSPTRLES